MLLQAAAQIADAAWIQCYHGCGVGLSCSFSLTPSLGTFICSRCSHKNKREREREREREEREERERDCNPSDLENLGSEAKVLSPSFATPSDFKQFS